MPATQPDVVFYWIPGCANCTRLKGYLTRRGVAFDVVNVQADPSVMEMLLTAGQRAFPAIRIGHAWVGADEKEIDAALGLEPAGLVKAVRPLVLIERSARMLDLAATLAMQLPSSNFDDPTPTMNGFVSASRMLADGQPYVPHGTSKSLVHHIAQHGTKAWRLMLASGGRHELGFAIDGSGDYSFFGEPEPLTPMYRVVAGMRLTASDMRAWLDSGGGGGADFDRELATHRGPRTIAQYLKVQTVGLVQHARQLGDILSKLDIEPHVEPARDDMDGLAIPPGIWD